MAYLYRALIFDFDDTLIDNKTEGVSFHQAVARSRNWRVPDTAEIEKYWGLSWSEFIKKLWPAVSFREFQDAYVAYQKKYPRHYQVLPAALKTLKGLKGEGFLLGVLSNRYKKNILDILERLDFPAEIFGFILGEEEVLYPKPDPRAFDPIIAELGQRGILPAEILYLGDTLYDIQASRGSKIKFIGVLTGLMDRQEFREAGIASSDVITSLEGLPHWLKKYGQIKQGHGTVGGEN